ncbi:MAG: hypothetical protein OEY59_02595 [Deltaproteobacteria bacterium]|nr:hypothetical protein [Deltaproteobacteria bacterium]
MIKNEIQKLKLEVDSLLIPLWKKLDSYFELDDMLQFAKILHQLGEKFKLMSWNNFAEELKEKTNHVKVV